MKYEILLINITRDAGGYSVCFNDSIGQYLIASYLRQHDFKAYVFTGTVLECEKVIEKELSSGNVGIVGFYAAADNIRVVANIVRWIKSTYDAVTIVGGPQAIALDAEFFRKTHNDYAIIGEGEIPMHLLLSAVVDNIGDVSDVPSLVYPDTDSGTLIWNKCDDAVIDELDNIPWPQMEDSYDHSLRQGEMVGIITGRGCPNHCAFCYEGANAKRVRLRSIGNVMDEIDYILSNNSSVRYINIYDDTFTLSRERVLEFCAEIKKRRIKWFCEGHVSFVVKNPDIISEMVNSGLICMQLGIESGNDNVLRAYGKNTTADMIRESVDVCRRAGLHSIVGNFIIGGAFDTKESIGDSMRLASELINIARGLIELYTVYFAPYPNTRMSNNPSEFGIKIDSQLMEFSLNTMRSPVASTTSLSAAELYDIKHEFDGFLAKLYYEAAKGIRKSELLASLFHEETRIRINPTWEKYYTYFPHLETFIGHLSEQEQTFSSDRFLIRTIEDFKIEDDKIITSVGDFSGIQMKVLLNATGIYSGAEMAQKLCVTIDAIKQTYTELNERCLLYTSKF